MALAQLPIVIIQRRNAKEPIMAFLRSLRSELTKDMVGYMAVALAITAIVVFFNHLPS